MAFTHQHETYHEQGRSRHRGRQVQRIGVADREVNADGGPEPGRAGEGERLPEAARRPREQRARDHDGAAAEEPAAEARAIVRDEGDEPGIGRVEVPDGQAHEGQVLGNEDAGHPDDQDRGAREEHPEPGGRERRLSQAPAAVEGVEDGVHRADRAVPHEGARPHDSGREQRGQEGGPDPVPAVQVAVAEIGEKAREAEGAADQDGPPRPRGSRRERHRGQPEVENRNRDQDPAEGHPIVEHERHHAAVADRAELVGCHAEERDVVGQELAAHGEEDREGAGEEQGERGAQEERAAVGHDHLEQARVLRGSHGTRSSFRNSSSSAFGTSGRSRTRA